MGMTDSRERIGLASPAPPAGGRGLGLRGVLLGLALAGAGVAVVAWAAALAADRPAQPFGYGIQLYAPPKGWDEPQDDQPEERQPEGVSGRPGDAPPEPEPSAEAAGGEAEAVTDVPAAETDESPQSADLESLFGTLSPEDVEAARAALGQPADAGVLPVRLMRGLGYRMPGSRWLATPLALALVPDAEADRALVPLAGEAAVYVGLDADLADVLARYDFPAPASEARAARLPEAATCLEGLLLVRASAAEQFGFEAGEGAPNLLVAEVAPIGSLEPALSRAWPLVKERGISPRPIDLELAPAEAAWGVGVAGLALVLAGGTVLVAGVVLALGRRAPARHAVAEYVLAGARVAAGNRAAYGWVLAAMCLALVVGAAWGGPADVGLFLRTAGAGHLAKVGLTFAPVEPQELLNLLFLTVVANVLLWGLLVMGIPGLVPGLGLMVALVHNVAWGAALAPATLTFLERLPVRGAVVAIELQAYALMALGAWNVLLGLVKPEALGQTTRKLGYAAGVDRLYRMLPLVVALVVAAALAETLLVAAFRYLA